MFRGRQRNVKPEVKDENRNAEMEGEDLQEDKEGEEGEVVVVGGGGGGGGEEEDENELEEYGAEQEEEDFDDDEPLQPQEDKELLFLIEFLVDSMTIKAENMKTENIDPCALQGPVTVVLTFLHFPPVVINEKDIDSEKLTGSNTINFNSGKSLMFALTESQFEEPPPVFLAVSATRKMPHAFRFSDLLVGKTKINLSQLFKQVFDKYLDTPEKTVSKSIKDKFELIGEKDKPAGEVTIYIRLTCLGENIVTEFQKGDQLGEPILFKNKESKKVYQCKSTEFHDDSPGTTLPGWGVDKKFGQVSQPSKPIDPEDENFEEIFAEINGSAIIIKVEKSRRREPPKQFHVSDFCDCNIPLPHDLVAGLSDLSLSPASRTSINFGRGTPLKAEKRVEMDSANQLIFQVPPVENLAQPGHQNSIKYNVKTCNEIEQHGHKGQNNFRVITDNNLDGPPPTLPNDPEKDVFVLRIIKRGRKDKGKDSLKLEFKTPKEKIVPPTKPPFMVDRAIGPDKFRKEKTNKRR